MASDNVQANASTTAGAIFRSFSDGTNEWCASVVCYVTGGSADAWTLQQVDATHGLPVTVLGSVTASISGTPTFSLGSSTVPVSGTFWQATQPVSGTLTVNAGSGTFTTSGTSTVSFSGTPTFSLGSSTVPVSGTFWPTTQPVSGTITANAGSGTFTTSGSTTATISGTVPVSGTFWQAVQAVSGTVSGTGNFTIVQAAAASLNATVVGTGTFVVQAAQSGTWNVATVTTVTTVSAVTAITNALPAGTNLLGKTGIDQTTPGTTNGVQVLCGTTGGRTMATLAASAATNNATNVKASAGILYGLQVFSLAAYPVFVKLYNKASAPAPASDTPVKTIMIPCNSTAANGAAVALNFGDQGLTFGTGIGYAIVKGQAVNDNTSVLAGDATLNIDYA